MPQNIELGIEFDVDEIQCPKKIADP